MPKTPRKPLITGAIAYQGADGPSIPAVLHGRTGALPLVSEESFKTEPRAVLKKALNDLMDVYELVKHEQESPHGSRALVLTKKS